jgi:hypothetical protein
VTPCDYNAQAMPLLYQLVKHLIKQTMYGHNGQRTRLGQQSVVVFYEEGDVISANYEDKIQLQLDLAQSAATRYFN